MNKLIKIAEIRSLDQIQNRDGELKLVKDDKGQYYLVLDSETGYGSQEFEGLRETSSMRISEDLYLSLIVAHATFEL